METVEIETSCLTLRSERDGNTHILCLAGEFDLSSAEAFEAEMRRVEQDDAALIIVSLEDLTFLDSTGLQLLLQATMRSRLDADRLRFFRPVSPQVQSLLRLTSLEGELDFLD